MTADRRTLLVVDDEADIRLLVRVALERHGYRVVEASGGKAALDVVAKDCPDCMLLDLRMPEIDGWEVLHRLRAGGYTLPVVVQSAHARGATESAALAAGARAFVAKPFNLDGLAATVDRVLREAC